MKENLQIETGVPNWLLLTIILACASPAITLNVWPRIDAMIGNGVNSNQIGIVLLVTLSALGMTAVPFAMKKAENIGFWLTCLAFGIGLGILNYTMAVGAVGKSRDDEAGLKSLVIQKANSLKLAISEGEESRRALPPFKWTTQEMVSTAAKAVDLAIAARDQECGKVGDICRARVAQLSNRQSELADISANRATTERAQYLDDNIRSTRIQLAGLGTVPESTDQQASRIASVLGIFIGLGPKSAETVATGLIHFLAICAEAFALGMPRIIVTALARKENPLETRPNNPSPIDLVVREQPTDNARKNSSVPRATSGPRSTNNSLPNGSSGANISEWKSTFLIRSTGRIRDWEAYEHYKKWSKEKTIAQASFLAFNQEIEKLGVKRETDPTLKRDFYLEVAIKQPLKAVS